MGFLRGLLCPLLKKCLFKTVPEMVMLPAAGQNQNYRKRVKIGRETSKKPIRIALMNSFEAVDCVS